MVLHTGVRQFRPTLRFGAQFGRSFATEPQKAGRPYLKYFGGFLAANGAMQMVYGSKKNFFDYRFITKRSGDDLHDFYGAEDFMQIFCCIPLVEHIMMRGSSFDDQGVCHTWGLAGKMLVSIDFEEGECEADEQSKKDGKPYNVSFFNKAERFHDVVPFFGITLWDMVQNFGFHERSDGTVEVYHQGELWYGPWPLRLLFHIHARYVIWATQRFVESSMFASEDYMEEAEEVRKNIPVHVMNEFIGTLVSQVESNLSSLKKQGKSTKEAEEVLKTLKDAKDVKSSVSVTTMKTQRLQRKQTRAQLKVDDQKVQAAINEALQTIDSDGPGDQSKTVQALDKVLADTEAESK